MVSVVLPFYNPGPKLEKAILSVLAQTAEIKELILVNNNSNDESVTCAKNYAQKYSNVVLVEERRQGVAHAMNCGLQHASETWIARIDADDTWEPQKIKRQLKLAKDQPNIEVIATQVTFTSDLEKVDGFETYVHWSNGILTQDDIRKHIFIESPLVNPSILFRRDLIERYGDYIVDELPEDYEMFLRWNSKGVQMGKVATPLMAWNDSARRLTRSHPAYSSAAFNEVKCRYLADWFKKQGVQKKGIWIWGAGRKTRLKASILEQYGIEIEGYIDLKRIETLEKPCIAYTDIDQIQNRFIASFVSNRGKGEEIRQYLLEQDRVEMEDFVLAG